MFGSWLSADVEGCSSSLSLLLDRLTFFARVDSFFLGVDFFLLFRFSPSSPSAFFLLAIFLHCGQKECSIHYSIYDASPLVLFKLVRFKFDQIW